MPDFRDLCARMTESLAQEAYVAFVQICKGGSDDAGTYDADEAIVRRALKRLDELESAALAEPEPADGEVAELVWWLRFCVGILASSDFPAVVAYLTRAADLLERLASPACLVVNPSPEAVQALKAVGPGRIELMPADPSQPVPVSERLPEPGDWVWHCYAGVRFWQHGIYNGRQFFVGDGPESQPATHWRPAHALPLPSKEVDGGKA